MQRGDLLVQVFRQHIDLVLVIGCVLPQLDLRQDLIGEGRAHHEARMARGAAEIHQPALGQKDDALAVGKLDLVDLRLDVVPAVIAQAVDLDLGVEMADIADDGAILHLPHVVERDDVGVAGRGDEDVANRGGVVHGRHLVTFHGCLQRADRIDLGDGDARTLTAQAFGAAFADIAIAADDRELAGEHDVGRALDAVGQTLAAAIEIIEFRLGDGVVHVDGREGQAALLLHLVEPVHARRRLLRHAAHVCLHLRIESGIALDSPFDGGEHSLLFVIGGRGEDRGVGLGTGTEDDDHRGVAAVVEDQIGGLATRPFQDLVDEVPIFLEAFALEGEHRRAAGGDG